METCPMLAMSCFPSLACGSRTQVPDTPPEGRKRFYVISSNAGLVGGLLAAVAGAVGVGEPMVPPTRVQFQSYPVHGCEGSRSRFVSDRRKRTRFPRCVLRVRDLPVWLLSFITCSTCPNFQLISHETSSVSLERLCFILRTALCISLRRRPAS